MCSGCLLVSFGQTDKGLVEAAIIISSPFICCEFRCRLNRGSLLQGSCFLPVTVQWHMDGSCAGFACCILHGMISAG
jgi:hypothetical protein